MSRPARPILKRYSESPSSSGSGSLSSYGSSSSPKVHFPPSTSLTSTYTAHSSSVYDRTPIKVSPNACALPERGCPGRTYVLDNSAYDDDASPPPSPSNYAPVDWRKSRRTGSPARVRVVGFDVMGRYRSVDCSESDEEHSPSQGNTSSSSSSSSSARMAQSRSTLIPSRPPSLVQDFSSESDESDGFIARISGSLDTMSISNSPRKSRAPRQLQSTPSPRRSPPEAHTPKSSSRRTGTRERSSLDDGCLGGF